MESESDMPAALTRQQYDGEINIRRDDGLLHITISGDLDCRVVYESIRDGHASGLIGLNIPTLVDMRNYTGSIEWREIMRIAALAPWGAPAGEAAGRVAYVSQARLFASIVKVVEILFQRSRHRHFNEPDPALLWLREALSA